MKTHHKNPIILKLSAIVVLVASLLLPVITPQSASASQITVRSLKLIAGSTNDGGSKATGLVNHLFTFTVPSGDNVGSIQFKYCTTADIANCVTPIGLDTTGATLNSQSGAQGFTMVNATNGAPYLTRAAASVTPGVLSYQLNDITNPTATNTPFYVAIATYGSTDATGLAVDKGTVAASTANQIQLSGTMPESLVFCTGATVGKTGGVPDCSTATLGAVNFNQIFSPTDTSTAHSQMAASTNAGSGYAITVNGPTMTSGLNTITGMNTMAPITHGLSQFGMNLKLNTTATSTVPVGAEVDVLPNGTNYRGQAAAGYDTVDNFKFTNGDPVAKSDNGGAGGTDSQIFTASYIVNVPGSQPAGTYTTTLTYICTPTF